MSSMTDAGRGPKDSRRHSSKQSSKSSQSRHSAPSKSRPKSDVNASSNRSSKHAPSTRRPLLQDRTQSEPTADPDATAIPASSPPNLPNAHSETFLLRSSIDRSSAPADSLTSLDRRWSGRKSAVPDEDAESSDHDRNAPARVVVRVVGAAGSGKTTFVNQYTNTQSSDDDDEEDDDSDTTAPAKGRNLDVVFQELTPNDVEVLDDGSIKWPLALRDLRGRSIGGVVVLYDVMNTESLKDLQDIIRALSDASTPTVLVASKCDFPRNLRKIDPDAIEKAVKSIFDSIQVWQVSQLNSDGPRACVTSLLKGQDAGSVESPSGKSLISSTGSHLPSSQTSSTNIAYVQRATEQSPTTPTSSASFKTPPPSRSKSQTQLQIQTSLTVPETAGDRSPRSFLDLEDSPRPSFGAEFEKENESDLGGRVDDGISEAIFSPTESGATFDDLTNHLLYPPGKKNESTFESTFLCFYRFFSPPLRLLEAVIKHFDAHDGNIISPWVHEPVLDRDLTLLDKWINSYPGDFAKLAVRQKLRKFLSRIVIEHGIGEDEPVSHPSDSGKLIESYGDAARLASSASQIVLVLDSAADDDDTEWACADAGPLRRSRSNTFLSMSSQDLSVNHDPADLVEPLSRIMTSNPAYDAKLIFGGQSTRTLTAMGRSRRQPDSGSSSETLLNVAESAQRQATLLSPNPSQSFGKAQWRAFMAHPDENLARELTRIDWIMFSSIRPRDLIRHATISVSERARFHALENVSRMIDHFNHVAYWVTNIVLYRDKPKHRAQALEKFMRVARKLRELNNYNALGAIIAGIQGTAVHRLKATKDLVNQSTHKDFMKLEILMAATRGHSAYRLAWENTSTARVPFLPLHRRDLVVASSAGKTFVNGDNKAASPSSPVKSVGQSSRHSHESLDDVKKRQIENSPTKPSRQQQQQTVQPPSAKITPQPDPGARINWKKFAIMGDILHNLIQAQGTPYVGFSANEDIKSLVLDHVMLKDDDELYERSTTLEHVASASASTAAAGAGGAASSFGESGTMKNLKFRIGQLVG